MGVGGLSKNQSSAKCWGGGGGRGGICNGLALHDREVVILLVKKAWALYSAVWKMMVIHGHIQCQCNGYWLFNIIFV